MPHNHHDHHGHHGHHDHHDNTQRNLLVSALLNLVISIAEIVGGLISNSLSLLSDALHNLGDTSAIFIAWMAGLISRKDRNDKKTFGYKRAEILAALFNAIVLAVIIFYLFMEAWQRLRHPEPVKGLIMLAVASVGLVANLASVLLLKKHASESLNVRAAYLHLLGDTVSSVIVIITAILIYFFNLYWIDPVVTFVLGLYLLRETWHILKEALDILMQGTPPGLDLQNVKKQLEQITGIDNIHHVHAWNLNDRDIHFECHVDLRENIRISDTESIQDDIRRILLDQFQINHVTIQYEYNCCEDKNMIHPA
jgi:cobalt-zinc-cadmium efflux system protein